MKHPSFAYSLSVLVLIAGCGGGGGGGSNDNTASTVVAITSSNAPQASSEAANSSSQTIGAAGTGSDVITGVAVQADSDGRPSIASLVIDQILLIDRHSAQLAPAVATGAVISEAISCTGGGNVSVSWNDADNDSDLSAGDSFSLTFNSCIEEGIILNGGMSLTGLTLYGDPDIVAAWSLGATVSFSSFQASFAGDTATLNGDISLRAETSNGINVETELSGNSLSLQENGRTTTLRSFSYAFIEDLNTLQYTLTASGSLQSSRLGGTVTFSTPNLLTGQNIAVNWPTSGSMKITGANSSSVTLTVLGGDDVRLDVDSDGDGLADDTIFSTWTALEAL